MMASRDRLRIEDLRRPVLTSAASQALEEAERVPAELTVDAVLAAASRITGLDDFGPDDFRERIHFSFDEITADPGRTAFGRNTIFQRFVRYGSTRLKLRDLLRRHPEIMEVEIKRPIIVVGLPRSGSTHLHNLLAADPRLQSLPVHEVADPIPAGGRLPSDDSKESAKLLAEERLRYQSILPHAEDLNPVYDNHVEEEVHLQGPDFPRGLWDWIIPNLSREDHLKCDQSAHYRYMSTLLKAIQWRRGSSSRWILKSTLHAIYLRSLLAEFPDATIVMTHRDPVAAVQSVATWWAYDARLNYREIDTDLIIGHWVNSVELLLRNMLRDRSLISSDRLLDSYFNNLVIDEFGVVNRVLAKSGLGLTAEQSERMKKFLQDHRRGQRPKVVYDLRGDFGIAPEELRTRFSFYYEQFPEAFELC